MEKKEFIFKLKETLSSHGIKDSERRKETRFYFKKEDKAIAEVNLPNMLQPWAGNIENLSYGGVTILFQKDIPVSIAKGDTLYLIQIIIDEFSFPVRGTISFRSDNKIGVAFLELPKLSQRSLAQLINKLALDSQLN